MDFIYDNQVEINFKTKKLAIGNKFWSMKSVGKPECHFIEKADLCRAEIFKEMEYEIPENLKQQIAIYQEENPEIGSIPSTKHKIQLMNKTVIARSKPFSLPFQKLSVIKEEINRLLGLGIIRRSESPFASPAFVILKKNGTARLVVDYRKLNSNTISEAYPCPNINECCNELKGLWCSVKLI
uniref:Retrovirus-related Pol polyprotein from transposon 176 (Trinotate prediction) n=1 Tax=Henneguya salminicola TaxID=69463 RepID=A0A6G3MKE7_HENSL